MQAMQAVYTLLTRTGRGSNVLTSEDKEAAARAVQDAMKREGENFTPEQVAVLFEQMHRCYASGILKMAPPTPFSANMFGLDSSSSCLWGRSTRFFQPRLFNVDGNCGGVFCHCSILGWFSAAHHTLSEVFTNGILEEGGNSTGEWGKPLMKNTSKSILHRAILFHSFYYFRPVVYLKASLYGPQRPYWYFVSAWLSSHTVARVDRMS